MNCTIKPSLHLLIYSVLLAFSINNAGANASATGCETSEHSVAEYEQAIQLGFKTLLKLEQLYQTNGDEVVLIARIGSQAPVERFVKRLGDFWQYTHAGIAYRNHPLGKWTVVHLLNTCNNASSIFAQGLMRFSLDKPFRYSNAIGRLDRRLQNRLEEVVIDQELAVKLHSRGNQYSSVSWPYSLKYQNSNEYILATLVTAIAPADQQPRNRRQAKDYFINGPAGKQFEPEHVKVGFFERLGKAIGLGAGNASLDDHTRKERSKGRLEFVSVGSLFNVLQKMDLLEDSIEISIN